MTTVTDILGSPRTAHREGRAIHYLPLLVTGDGPFIRDAELLLLSQGISSRWQRSERVGVLTLEVDLASADLAVGILSALALEHRVAPTPAGRETEPPRFPMSLVAAVAVAMACALTAIYLVVGGTEGAREAFRLGVLVRSIELPAEWWRLVTASCLHADGGHLLGNVAFLLVLLVSVGERSGPGLAMLFWLLTAMAGFGVSLLYGQADATVGASGGVFGLLGAAGAARFHGSAERPLAAQAARLALDWLRRPGIRTFGAAASLLAFTAFGARSNIAAHLGGFVSGALLQLSLGRLGRLPETWQIPLQFTAAAGTLVVCALAWFEVFQRLPR